MPRRAGSRAFFTVLTLAFAGGCAPKVKCFRVVKHTPASATAAPPPQCTAALPVKMCAPGAVDVTWQVAGKATLSATPAATCSSVPSNGRVHAKGTATCQIDASTRLKVHASSSVAAPVWWKYDEGLADVTVGATPGPLGRQGACAAEGYAATLARDPLEWDPEFRVVSVSVAGQLLERLQQEPGLALRVVHGGVEGTLDGASPTSERFRCLPYGGDWTLTLPVSPGRSCADDPVFLSVQVATSCGPCPGRP